MSGIVAKFGGSSVKNASAMIRCMGIIKNNPDINFVILSATFNTTNELEKIIESSSSSNRNTTELITSLKTKHINIAKEVGILDVVESDLIKIIEECHEILGEINNSTINNALMDRMYAIGETLSTLIFSQFLKKYLNNSRVIKFIDARNILKTDSTFKRAHPNFSKTQKSIDQLIDLTDPKTLYVTQGFIGSDEFNNTTTLGREGSDYTAAIIGEAINAKLVQIWTDTPGIAFIDPKLFSDARYLKNISYDDAERMAKLGAKILFPETVMPLKRKKIPLFIGSSSSPELGGTNISNNPSDNLTIGITVIKSKEIEKNYPHLIEFYLKDHDIVSLILRDADRGENIKTCQRKASVDVVDILNIPECISLRIHETKVENLINTLADLMILDVITES